jgi:hypothetical protein
MTPYSDTTCTTVNTADIHTVSSPCQSVDNGGSYVTIESCASDNAFDFGDGDYFTGS